MSDDEEAHALLGSMIGAGIGGALLEAAAPAAITALQAAIDHLVDCWDGVRGKGHGASMGAPPPPGRLGDPQLVR